MAIPQSFIQELLSRVDVVDIVGKYVQLKKGGANFMGLCPFHGEKSPSFSVSPTKQFFHCFGCGKNGNAIGFLMEHAGMTFIEAVKDLAQQTGMQVPEEQQSPEDRARAGVFLAFQYPVDRIQSRGTASVARCQWNMKVSNTVAAMLSVVYMKSHPASSPAIASTASATRGQRCCSGSASASQSDCRSASWSYLPPSRPRCH